MIHAGGYGGIDYNDAVIIDGYNEALIWQIRGDNSGPADPDEVVRNYDYIKKQFPTAKQIKESTFDAFVANLLQRQDIVNTLPVFTGEIGDTWLYGVPSDPLKVLQYRELMRARDECIKTKRCDPKDSRVRNFSRMLTKIAEHTW